MEDSLFEQLRALHEETEHLENVIVKDLLEKKKTQKERLCQEHRINKLISKMQENNKKLYGLYLSEESEENKKKEIKEITTEDFSEFYIKLKEIKDSHKRNGIEPAKAIEILVDVDEEMENLESIFSGAENLGRSLDLTCNYEDFRNLKLTNFDCPNYISYLDKLDRFHDIKSEDKKKKKTNYFSYISSLSEYLKGFIERSQPLFNLESCIEKEGKYEFERLWKMNRIPGWNNNFTLIGNEDQDGDGTNLLNSLYCIACKKLFAKQTVFDSHLKGKKHILNSSKKEMKNDDEDSKEEIKQKQLDKMKEIPWIEFKIRKYLDILSSVRENTKSIVERKQTLTVDELNQDLQVQEVEQEKIMEKISAIEEDEDEERIYNPLKIPLGWDGKPIPYWLFKLYGLGIEYKCEICGGYIYMGRKAFERHFQEARHSNGLRCLGIPNSRNFNEIVFIDDAIALWEKIRSENDDETERTKMVEEFEDSHGNIFNKRTYDDLRKQGLL